ncbi:uncharacterized protein NECHADRAFT_77274 [Fusarium vanettenii 77-13-4]|uniref:Heterokaryon incompatibility domain-containing protein n=1 Tax=Fusarium vanettenii (strain ATCC MYA-4622 / CBS 123669 / FGSC 9596 / NRRL 45880 / 77-13-4) TaxID=660122 RepID=C7ZJJ4_FUSV7|nr:uncharacterized protein NECHADRAFT_77274 [Fusarium vanettenii 77-13-4]EEU35860.1 predicted protein [Fusarium vanettenii 77-13-4]
MTTRGCALCELIAKAIQSYLEISGKSDEVRRAQTSAYIQLHQKHGHRMVVLGFKPAGRRFVHIGLANTRRSTPSECIIQNLVNWDRTQGWLNHCIQEHRCKRSEHSAVPEGFRLIDVDNRCVTSEFGQQVKLGVDINFVALSYVWGGSNVSRDNALLKSNKSEFEAAGGLKKGKVPQAIEDAITICKRLKQRYLWVDRFCIIQNNEDGGEKQRQINAMGEIYSSAEFTIIHASGESIHCPILGVSKERKVLQSKKLVFTSFEVWFECNDPDDPCRREDQFSAWVESENGGYKERIAQFRINLFSRWDKFAFTNFVRHLESYTARSLTNQADILNAFTGVLASVYQGERCFHGLPEADFDQALLWYCKDNDRPTRSGEDCPSWSWTSVSEEVTGPVINSFAGFVGTLVWWAYRDPETGLRAIKACNSLQPRPEPINRSIPSRSARSGQQQTVQTPDYSPQIHLLLAWWKGCIEAPVPDDLDQQLENYSEESYSGIADRWPSLEKVWDDIRSARNAGPEEFIDFSIGLRKEDQPLIDQLPSRALLTRTQTARFTVSRKQDDRSSRDLSIVDADGKRIGKIEGQDGSVTGLTLTESKESQELCEFMAISLSQNRDKPGGGWMFPGRLDEESKLCSMHNRLFHGYSRVKDGYGQPVVNALLIGRTEQPWLAHRISVGWVYLADWCKAQREFKTIALE